MVFAMKHFCKGALAVFSATPIHIMPAAGTQRAREDFYDIPMVKEILKAPAAKKRRFADALDASALESMVDKMLNEGSQDCRLVEVEQWIALAKHQPPMMKEDRQSSLDCIWMGTMVDKILDEGAQQWLEVEPWVESTRHQRGMLQEDTPEHRGLARATMKYGSDFDDI